MTRLTKVLLSVFLLALGGCVGPLIPVVKLDQESAMRLSKGIRVFDIAELQDKEYRRLGQIEATSCMNKLWDPPASKEDATDQLRYKASALGGNGFTNLICERREGTNLAKNCWNSVTCYGVAIALELSAEKQSNVAAETTSSPIPKKSVVKSDVDDLPAIKALPNKKAYAIVIGIENYRQKLPKADFATHDAETVALYLTKVMGYPEENVVTLLNDHASNVDLAKYFENWLPNNAEKDSTVFIYYSGHGAPNTKTGDAFLVPYDGDPSFIDQTGYSLKRFYDSLGKLQAKEIIVALDSCFSGAGGRSVIAKGARPLVMTMDNLIIPSKIAVLSASSGEQTSSTYEEKGHGLFTYFLLKGIKGADDTNKNGTLEVRELFNYIKPQVELIARKVYNNEQTPQMTVPKENQKIFLRK